MNTDFLTGLGSVMGKGSLCDTLKGFTKSQRLWTAKEGSAAVKHYLTTSGHNPAVIEAATIVKEAKHAIKVGVLRPWLD